MTEFKRNVIFDLDDTLIPNVYNYRNAKKKVVKELQYIFKHKISEEDILSVYGNFDITKTKELGLNRARFPLSAVETYYYYCNLFHKEILIKELQDIFIAANSVFDEVLPLDIRYEKTINKIKELGFEVFLLTSGDDIIQMYKIYKSGIYKIIDEKNIIIIPCKDENTYINNFKDFGMENCVMIGNSKKSDINPALNVGMYAIHIPEDTWEYENDILQESNKLYSTTSITKVPNILNKIFK